MTQVQYNPKSFGSIMRAIHTLLLAELETGSPEVRTLHQQQVKLRQKIEAAYKSQFSEGSSKPGAVALADIAMVVLRRAEKGSSMNNLLSISKGKLIKLARKGLAQ